MKLLVSLSFVLFLAACAMAPERDPASVLENKPKFDLQKHLERKSLSEK